MVSSVLDTDYYVVTMCNALMQLCPDVQAEYMFVDRNKQIYDDDFLKILKDAIKDMAKLRLQNDERDFLNSFPYLNRGFLEYFQNFRFNPDEVIPTLNDKGHLDITIKGPLISTIWWEVPLMATISEIYFTKWKDNDKKWNYNGQGKNALSKGLNLSNAGCKWADFGTRRRRSFQTQQLVVENMCEYDNFAGTSNVMLAMRHGTKAIGTMAHQWIQIWSALDGLRHANRFAMDKWQEIFRGKLDIFLTDTFGTDAFLKDFDLYRAKLFSGTRQDSGDPIVFADKMVNHYNSLGINPETKTIIFSDSLNVEKTISIKKHCDNIGIQCSFGIGTALTNSFEGPLKPLNIVIKLVKVNGIPVVKLSDDPGKAIGDPDAIKVAKWTFDGQLL